MTFHEKLGIMIPIDEVHHFSEGSLYHQPELAETGDSEAFDRFFWHISRSFSSNDLGSS